MREQWLDLARDSRKAANELVQGGRFRSAAARAYYAAYSKVSHELIEAGQQMPGGWEGPTHKKLRPMIAANLNTLDESKRIALSGIVGRMYTLRIYADYQPASEFGAREAREAVSLMKKVFDSF